MSITDLILVMLNILMYCNPIFFILITSNIPVAGMSYQSEWKTMWTMIRFLGQKPTDWDLQCFQKRINPC